MASRLASCTAEDRDHGSDIGLEVSGRTMESEDYASDPDNVGIYDVNTIANYDRDIIPLLDASDRKPPILAIRHPGSSCPTGCLLTREE